MTTAGIVSDGRRPLAVDLLYPSALGAGIAWWVESALAWKSGAESRPTGWALMFGLFFLVYHSRRFVVRREPGDPERYTQAEWWLDLVDCTALVVAFLCLRLVGDNYRCVDPIGAYTMALIIPLYAVVVNADRRRTTWVLRLLACAVAGAGIGVALSRFGWTVPAGGFVPSKWDLLVLWLLWLLLALYLFRSKWFHGPTEPDTRAAGQWPGFVSRVARFIGRPPRFVGHSVFVAAGVITVIIWLRVLPCEPQTPRTGQWVKAGQVQLFVSADPCSATPSIQEQMRTITDSLEALKPERIQVVGSTDVLHLGAKARGEQGNNAGLARSRINCIAGWITTTNELSGIPVTVDVRRPANVDSIAAADRTVVVNAFVSR